MVSTTSLNDERVWACDVCGLAFQEEELAERCEAHCRDEDSCNLEIGRQAVGNVHDDARF